MGVQGPVVTAHPFTTAVGKVFFLPNRDAGLHFVDDVTAGLESGVTVVGGDADDDCEAANFDRADAMDAGSVQDLEFLPGLFDDSVSLLLGEERVSLVFEPLDGAAFVVVADPAFERAEAS